MERTPPPLTNGPARVHVAQSDLQQLVKQLKALTGVRKNTPLFVTANRAGVITFSGAIPGTTLDCEGTWATPLRLSLKSFRDFARAIPPDDPISLEAVEGNLVIADRLTIYHLKG